MFTFEWDEEKAAANLIKHRVSFFEAATVFDDQFSLTIDDPLHSIGEQRFIVIGFSEQQRLLAVVHTERGDNIRIISARTVSKREQQYYEQQ